MKKEHNTEGPQHKPGETTAASPTRISGSSAGAGDGGARRRAGLDDYEILDKVAQGGMGEVFKARQISLNRVVALKRIRGGGAGAQARERFRTEAEAAARLDHPNIVPIYEVGESDGEPFFSMRFIEGQSLAAWDASQDRGTPEAFGKLQCEAARLVARTAAALHYAHQHGVLHRDIKPGNILLDSHGEPQLTDFGLAKILESAQDLTVTQAVLGTPSYMAPEQAGGNAKRVTTAADIYSLGAVLYHLLTGRPPFLGSTAVETVMKVVNEEPLPPSTVVPQTDVELESICLKCLEKDPGSRYGSAEALADDLERWLRHEPVTARPASLPCRLRKWARRRPAVATLAAALLGLGVTGFGGVLWQWRDAKKNESHALDALYAADLSLAYQAFSETRYHRAEQALNRQSRFSDDRDRRHFEWNYLRDKLGDMDGEPIGRHPLSVGDIEWIPGTTRFASVAWDAVRIWDLKTKQELFQLKADRHDTLAISPDGQTLVSAGGAPTNLIIWDLGTHTPRAALQVPEAMIRSLACSPLTNEIAALTLSGTILRIDPASGAIKETLPPAASWKGEPTLPGDIIYAPDGKAIIAGGCRDGKAYRYSLGRREKPAEFNVGFSLQALAFTQDGRYQAVGGWGREVRLWDLSKGELIFVGNHQNWVSQVRFARQDALLVSAGADQAVRWWDWRNRRLLGVHLGRVEVWALAISPDGQQAVVGGKDGSVWRWSLERGAPAGYEILVTSIFDAPHSNNQQMTSPAGSAALSFARMEGDVRVWEGGKEPRERTIFPAHAALCVAAFPRSQRLAVGTAGGTVEVWATDSMERVCNLAGPPGAVKALRVHQDDRTISAAFADGIIAQWRIADASGMKVGEWKARGMREPYGLSPDGSWLAGVDPENRIVVWSLTRRQVAAALEAHAASVNALQFTPDSGRLVSGSEDQVARIWRVRDWVKEGDLLGLSIHGLAISPDGKRVAVASAGKQPVTLWDLNTRDQVGLLPGPGDMLRNLAFSGDGQTLFAAAGANRLVIWKAPRAKW